MPSRFVDGIGFVKKSWNGVPLRFVLMDKKMIEAWDNYVSPEIKIDPCRVDCSWDWDVLIKREVKIARILNQKPYSIAIVVPLASQRKVFPVGMMLLACRYQALHNPSDDAVFLWYISAAPKSAIKKWLPANHQPEGIGKIMVDLAITISINKQYRGNAGLHAAQPVSQCSDYLPGWYSNAGLMQLPPSIFISYARYNDGRYYYTDVASALAISVKCDLLR